MELLRKKKWSEVYKVSERNEVLKNYRWPLEKPLAAQALNKPCASKQKSGSESWWTWKKSIPHYPLRLWAGSRTDKGESPWRAGGHTWLLIFKNRNFLFCEDREPFIRQESQLLRTRPLSSSPFPIKAHIQCLYPAFSPPVCVCLAGAGGVEVDTGSLASLGDRSLDNKELHPDLMGGMDTPPEILDFLGTVPGYDLRLS